MLLALVAYSSHGVVIWYRRSLEKKLRNRHSLCTYWYVVRRSGQASAALSVRTLFKNHSDAQ